MSKGLLHLRRHLGNNFGDNLSTFIVESISSKEVKNIERLPDDEIIYMVIGSILQAASPNSIIWGTGYIRFGSRMKEKPLKICAVRGKVTRGRLIDQGFDCPEIYGDPSLLCPKYYKPTITNKFKLGVMPHYADQDYILLERFREESDVLFINVYDPVTKVMDEINSCERIMSSSLHGIIVADAYGIPSLWMKLSDKITGHGFKFRDYFSSVERKNDEPLILDNGMSMDFILNSFEEYKIQIDLDKLWEACPFKGDNSFE